MQIHVPRSGERYYVMPMLDMWTDVFANPGKRTTGTAGQDFLIVAPGYTSRAPDGVTLVVAPTPVVWIIGRTQTNGPNDYGAVNAFQDGWRTIAPSEGPEHSRESDVDTATEPLRLVDAMAAVDLFSHAARLLGTIPPHATDFSQHARLALLGIVPGQDIDVSRFDRDDLAEIDAGVQEGRDALALALAKAGTPINGWSVQTYGNYYLKRALVALVGLGANPPEDAIYPVLLADDDGEPPSGSTNYVIHYEADDLPPVGAFWSITMYDAEGFQVANEIDRFAIGNRDPLTYNANGSLDLYIQQANPGPDAEANWLPAPAGPMGITMRLYAPKREALTGDWKPPPVHKASYG